MSRDLPVADFPLGIVVYANWVADGPENCSGSTCASSFTFIIPVRNDAASLTRCLRSILHQSSGDAPRLVVADNGSTDGSGDAARALGADVLDLPGLRVGALRNQAAAVARTPYLAFVDADHELGEGWLEAAIGAITLPNAGAAGAPYSSPPAPTWVQRFYDAFRRRGATVEDVDWLGAGNLVVRTDVFRLLNGFDSDLEACEDVDFCQRLRRSGRRLLNVPNMRSVHFGDPSSLSTLFRSELWRGRDNLRVSLSGPLTPGALPSVVIPVADLVAFVTIVAGLVARSWLIAALGAAIVLGFTVLRAFVLWRRVTQRTAADAPRALAVAAVYDVARALALIARTPHRRARGAAAPIA
jgi:glycosyltransferase involved in cell wall biosynthesis